jgi:riboflavin synthase
MFTGIVSNVGTVRRAEQRGDLRLEIAPGFDLAAVELGASIACSGVCLTVVDKGDDWFAVDLSAETVSRTAADLWREGARLISPVATMAFSCSIRVVLMSALYHIAM